MNRLTIFGDIHDNLPALEAVLANMEAHALSPLYCLGDLVGYGTFPNEVIETIWERNIPTLMGNYDQGVGKSSDDCGCAYSSKEAEALGKRSIGSSEHGQIASADAPTDPAVEADQAMRQAATQIVCPFQDTDTIFNTCMPLATFHKPDFVFLF